MHKLIAVALLGLASAGSALAAAPTTQILQQRTADGSLLLTDHAAPGAKTERSWQVEREDPAAARQRAIDVKAEANLVTERVQRMLDQQQRRADDDAMRMRSQQYDHDRQPALDAQDGYGYGFGGGGIAIPFRGSRFTGPPIGNVGVMDPLGTRGSDGRHGSHGKPSRSGSPGSHSRW